MPAITGRYVPVTVGGVTYQIYSESAGSGQDVLCMHTAGADGRQFHGLMADPRIVQHHRLISFDLPWHGKSPPPEGEIQGSWRLNTDLYVALIMSFIAAAGLQKRSPVSRAAFTAAMAVRFNPASVSAARSAAMTAAKLPNFEISAFATGFTSPRGWAANRINSSSS